MAICYIGIGSNLGNRRKNIRLALQMIEGLKYTRILKKSGLHETKPAGGPRGQGDYLNAAIKISTMFSPRCLLKELKLIECQLGRKKGVRWGPRVIDLDILFFANKRIKTRELVIPHPRIFMRDFVIMPLSEIIC